MSTFLAPVGCVCEEGPYSIIKVHYKGVNT